ncbi:uncharacterized protein LOC132552262 [Ylistrum balloti]|uniref:uncharacterized protein LOC132552262 n=1 Tax=Ylistrum balloti TaxID=509963 RepID=UPI002905C258|nr:uncharacterized protein LOC132552262 [Ylistrum balloti]
MEATPTNKRSRGKRCVAYGCGNTTLDGVSLHFFPLDRPEICKVWTAFVRRKRDLWDGPTKHSVLCSEHFGEDCYPMQYRFLQSMGRTPPKKKTLIKDAVPTINKGCTNVEETPVKRPRTAFAKRENRRIVEQCLKESSTVSTDTQVEEDPDVSASDEVMELPEEHVQTRNDHDYFSCNFKETPSKTKTCGTQLSLKPPKRKTVRIQVAPNAVEKGCQTRAPRPKVRHAEVQCNLLKPVVEKDEETNLESDSEYEDHLDLFKTNSKDLDDSYHPDSGPDDSDTELDMEENEDVLHSGQSRDRLLIIEESKLLELFDKCRHCLSPCQGEVTRMIGTMCCVHQECDMCGRTFKWRSQSMVGSLPRGNVQLSASILFSGSLPSKTLRIFNFMDIPVICHDTFFKHQRHYLQPTILRMWTEKQVQYFAEMCKSDNDICIGGDGRCDTPGHCAKFCSYSLMDLDRGTVVDIQLVQSNEVKHSVNMEKEGLIRSVDNLKRHGINIDTLVTDRHVQIRKWVRENMTETNHCVDVWHVAKGLKKKLLALSKERDCGELESWIKSLTNHLYWVPASTPSADGALMYQKWVSVVNHVQNIHDGHGDLFPCCLHDDLRTQERKKKWIKPESKVMEKLELMLTSPQMKKDIPMLSTHHQTSELEGYHSTVNQFAPKMHGFSFNGMLCRVILAALHHNENVRREQAMTSAGEKMFKIIYPKQKKGGYTVRKVKTKQTFDYVHELMAEVLQVAEKSTMQVEDMLLKDQPPPLCSDFVRPVKMEAVALMESRFNLNI